MTLPDKLSEAGAQQLATQIDFFQALTTRAFANAERILALNIQTTRAALDQTSGAARQLAGASDPRDIFALSNQSQQQMEALLEYGRKLMEITHQPAPAAAPAPAAPQAPVATAPPVMVNEPVAEAASAPEPAPERPASSILPSKHPLGEADPAPAPVMAAKPKPIARAAGKVASKPVDTPHPAAMPMPAPGPVAIPAIVPVDASAAPAPLDADTASLPKRAKGGKKR